MAGNGRGKEIEGLNRLLLETQYSVYLLPRIQILAPNSSLPSTLMPFRH